MIRLLLVDDHPVVQEGLAAILGSDPTLRVVGQVGSAEEALRRLPGCKPEVIIIDLRLPGMSGLDLCARLSSTQVRLRIIALDSHADASTMMKALEAGAQGFVQKGSSPSLIREAVRAVARGGIFIDPKVGGHLVAMASGQRAPGPLGLTRRELDVLKLFPSGLSYTSIAKELGLSRETVKTHARSIRRKFGVSSKVKAASVALRIGRDD